MTAMERILRIRWLQFPLWFLFLLVTCSAVALAHRPIGRTSPFTTTNRPLDVAIAGPGYFQVQDESGEFFYTRDGHLNVNADGQLVAGRLGDALVVQPAITIPSGTYEVMIRRDGQVLVTESGSQSATVGELQLATFMAPAGLKEVFPGFFAETVHPIGRG